MWVTHSEYASEGGGGDPSANGELYYASGTLSDWAYGGHGMLSFTVEMRPLASIPGFFLEPHLISTSGEETLQGLLGLTR